MTRKFIDRHEKFKYTISHEFLVNIFHVMIEMDMNKYMKRYRDEIREWFEKYKKTLKCEKCGESRFYVLDFHHVDPDEKEFEISSFIKRGKSKELITLEVKKCIVLCRNCHAEVHYLERNNGFIRKKKSVEKMRRKCTIF